MRFLTCLFAAFLAAGTSVSANTARAETCTLLQPAAQIAQKRVAFVAGNAAYSANVGALVNPENDANAISEKLRGLGFTVYRSLNASSSGMADCLTRITGAEAAYDISVFYYAGHGIQVDDQNYAVPVDIKLDDVSIDGFFSMDKALTSLRERSTITMAFLDACRDNPLKLSSAPGLSISTGVGQGVYLRRAGADQSKTSPTFGEFIVAYATSPFSVASDGSGPNSPFTTALLERLGKPGISVQQSLVEVTYDVARSTNWQQTPFTRSSLTRLVVLNEEADLEGLAERSKAFALDSIALLERGKRDEAIANAIKGIPEGLDEKRSLEVAANAWTALSKAYSATTRLIDFDGDLVEPKLSGDGRVLVGIYVDSNNAEHFNVWNVETGQKLHSLKADTSVLVHYGKSAVSADGRLVAFVAKSGSSKASAVNILEVGTGKIVHIDEALQNTHPMNSVPQGRTMEFNSDGSQLLVSGGIVSPLRVWDTTTGNPIAKLDARSLGIGSQSGMHGHVASFASDDLICFMAVPFGNNSPTLGVYSLSKSQTLWFRVADGFNPADSIACSSDGNAIAAGLYEKENWSMRLMLFTPSTDKPTAVSDARYDWMSLRFSQDSSRFAVFNSSSVEVYDATNGQRIAGVGEASTVNAASGIFSMKTGKRIGLLAPHMLSYREMFGHGLEPASLETAATGELGPENIRDIEGSRLTGR